MFAIKERYCKSVNLTIKGGIGPVQSQYKTAKEMGMVNWFTTFK
jgi:hypothetical protein